MLVKVSMDLNEALIRVDALRNDELPRAVTLVKGVSAAIASLSAFHSVDDISSTCFRIRTSAESAEPVTKAETSKTANDAPVRNVITPSTYEVLQSKLERPQTASII